MEKVRLSKIAQISAGQAAPKEFSDFGLPFIRAGHLEELIDGKKLNELPKVNDDIAKKNKLKVIPAGSILFAKSGMSATKNRIFITTENSYYVSHLAAVIPSPKYDSSYLARFLSWYNPTNLILDNAYPSIRLEDINNLEIPLPNLANQQRIAAILDQADAIIQNNRAIVQKYDTLTQSLFLDMFGDPVKNEKGWEKRKLGDLSQISSGSTPSRLNDNYFSGNIPWVKTGEVNGKIILDTEEKITKEALENSSCKLYPKGSLIIAMYGQGKTRGQIGFLGIDATTNQACAVIPPSEKINFNYLFQLLKLNYEDLRSLGRGGNQPNLNSGLIKSYEVINPPITLQNQFAERVAMIEAQKKQAQLELAKSEELFASLLQRAFNGELS